MPTSKIFFKCLLCFALNVKNQGYSRYYKYLLINNGCLRHVLPINEQESFIVTFYYDELCHLSWSICLFIYFDLKVRFLIFFIFRNKISLSHWVTLDGLKLSM